MTTYPLVRFTDEPSSSAAVRFDFKGSGVHGDDEAVVERDGFSFGSPSFEGDPDGIGVEYGLRELSLSLTVYGSHAAASRVLSRLGREIQRANWLMYQHDVDSSPVWFKTYPSAPGALSFEQMHIDKWQVEVSLSADPFAYGERVTLPTVTIANDPAAATNPMSYVLPEILGDAPAPLRVFVSPSVKSQVRALVNVSVVGADYAAPLVWQSASMTPSTDTSEVASATHSGGSRAVVTFATDATLQLRLVRGLISPTPPPGRYKLLARITRSDTSSAFDLRAVFGDVVQGGLVSVRGTSDAAWSSLVDLGDFALPPYGPDDSARSPWGNTPFISSTLSLYAGRTSGTGSLGIDYVLAVPVVLGEVPPRTAIVDSNEKNIGGTGFMDPWLGLDGDSDAVAILPLGAGNPLMEGGFPFVTPGETNALHLALHVATEPRRAIPASDVESNDDAISTTSEAVISYHPRWLYLGAD